MATGDIGYLKLLTSENFHLLDLFLSSQKSEELEQENGSFYFSKLKISDGFWISGNLVKIDHSFPWVWVQSATLNYIIKVNGDLVS